MGKEEPIMQMRPDPDPTVLTTANLLREIGSLKDLVFTRLDATDNVIRVFSDNITRVPTQLDKEIGQLKLLVWERFAYTDEKFAGVTTQFRERDIRVEQTAKASKEALDAALQAAEKAVGKQNEASSLSIAKSEAATNKQIDQLGELIKTYGISTSDKIDDLKERLLRFEGSDEGGKLARTSRREQTTSSATVIGVAAAIVLGVLSLCTTLFLHLAR
jgi:hypothetical protein